MTLALTLLVGLCAVFAAQCVCVCGFSYLLASKLLGLVEGLVEVIFTAAVGHFYCRWVGGWLVGTWYAWVVGGQKWLRDQRSNVVIDLVVVREQRDSKG